MKKVILAAIALVALQGCVTQEQKSVESNPQNFTIYGKDGKAQLLRANDGEGAHLTKNLSILRDASETGNYARGNRLVDSRHCTMLKLEAKSVMSYRQFTDLSKNGAMKYFYDSENKTAIIPLAWLTPMKAGYSDSMREVNKFGNTIYNFCNK